MKNVSRTSGFTIIELMIVLAIIPILAVVMSMAFVQYPRLYETVERERVAHAGARDTIDLFGRDVRSAKRIMPDLGPTTSAGDAVILEQTDGSVVAWRELTGDLVRVVYAKGGAVEKSRTVVARGVNATFAYDQNEPSKSGRVEVKIEFKSPDGRAIEESQFAAGFTLRGKIR